VVGAPLIIFMLGISLISIGRGDLPRWLGWTGLVAAVVFLANTVLGLASVAILTLVWVLALAITMTVRPQPHIDQSPSIPTQLLSPEFRDAERHLRVRYGSR